MAVHLAVGLLFLGGGKLGLSTSPRSIAAMIAAFFPKFPTHSNDNRYHLQVLIYPPPQAVILPLYLHFTRYLEMNTCTS